ncbi:MAG: hypothetical protein IJ831_10460 [Spirochaetales bacterium]|nr:hypothetical protein [Spirochaetales bacterium]
MHRKVKAILIVLIIILVLPGLFARVETTKLSMRATVPVKTYRTDTELTIDRGGNLVDAFLIDGEGFTQRVYERIRLEESSEYVLKLLYCC